MTSLALLSAGYQRCHAKHKDKLASSSDSTCTPPVKQWRNGQRQTITTSPKKRYRYWTTGGTHGQNMHVKWFVWCFEMGIEVQTKYMWNKIVLLVMFTIVLLCFHCIDEKNYAYHAWYIDASLIKMGKYQNTNEMRDPLQISSLSIKVSHFLNKCQPLVHDFWIQFILTQQWWLIIIINL